MTVADTKRFFLSVRHARYAVERLVERAQIYRSLAYKITTSLEGMPHAQNDNTSRVENYASRLIDLSEECNARVATLHGKIRQAQAVIDSLPKERYQEVLELRYLNCKKWEDIAAEMEYQDVRSVYKVHGHALVAASKFM